MKKSIAVCFMLIASLSGFSQSSEIPAAPADKAVVYFLRPSAMGFAINFTFFDSLRVVGRINGGKYIRVECEPGHHLLWGRSENRDYIDATVEAGKVYFIKAIPQMGMMKAGIRLRVIDFSNTDDIKMIKKLFAKKGPTTYTPEELAALQTEYDDVIKRGMAKMKEETAGGYHYDKLLPSMAYNNQ